MSTRKHKSVTGLLAAVALVVGAAAGVGGASLATWKDEASAIVVPVNFGQQYFAAGLSGSTPSPAPNLRLSTGSVNVTVDGPALASDLIASVNDPAAPIKGATRTFILHSLSQGNKGLSYTATAPTWTSGSLAAAGVQTEFFKVDSIAGCTLTAPATVTPQPVQEISPAYSEGDTLSEDVWCLRVIATTPDAGNYENTVSAAGTDPQGTAVTASPATPGTGSQPGSNVWKAIVTTALKAAGTPNATATFTYTTARPVS